jgi:hypothetical protein
MPSFATVVVSMVLGALPTASDVWTRVIDPARDARVQQPIAVVPRFGDLAPSLTADDLQQIHRLATRMGGQLWILFGDRGQIADWWTVAAFLKPGIVTATVRTGLVLWVRANVGPDQTAKRLWQLESAAMAAQVPLPGRTPDLIISDLDINRPFRIVGEWQPDEIASLVTFIRSSPQSANPKRGLAQVNGALPIETISREPDGTPRISLRVGPMKWHHVHLSRNRDTWIVTAVLLVMA